MSDSFGHNPFDKVLIPDVTDGTNSRAFIVPSGARTLTIHCPDLTGTPTLKIQAADPRDNDKQTLVFRDVSAVVIATTIGFCALAAIPENAATTVPVAALGGNVLRFVASSAQTGAPDNETILISWEMDE